MVRLCVRVSLFLLAATLSAGAVRAQDGLRPMARARVAAADSLAPFRTRPVHRGRLDVEAGVLRAAYRIQTDVAATATPEEAARAYMRMAAHSFGWPEDTHDLAVAAVQETPFSRHVTFRQTLAGVPVYGRQVKVNLDTQGQPTMVLSGYAPHLANVRGFDPTPSVSAETARDLAAVLFAARIETTAPELVVYPSDLPRLAWRLVAWPQGTPAEWEVLIDARTRETIQLVNQATHAGGKRGEDREERMEDGERREEKGEGERGRGRGTETEKRRHEIGDAAFGHGVGTWSAMPLQDLEPPPTDQNTHDAPATIVNRKSSILHPPSSLLHPPSSMLTGSGLVFDPDPVTTAGVAYGPPYVDQNDADVPELNAQRKEVALQDLAFRGGLYYLEGPYVQVVGDVLFTGGATYTPPSEADPNGFRYTRADDRFEAVMAYYHIDASQRYLQTLDLGRTIQAEPLPVNPQGFGNADNSQYFPSANAIAFGVGGVDDAEDAQVIRHEYAHALLEGSAPGLLRTAEGMALHEGWADYWAASYLRDRYERGEVPPGDWRRLFRWDGNNPSAGWCGRTLDHPGHYPDDMAYAPPAGCELPAIYQHGLLWATTLMEVYTVVGKTISDRLNLASHAYLGPPVTLRDAAEALLQADVDLYGGAHAEALLDILSARGFVDPEVYAPRLIHEPLPPTEDIGGVADVFVSIEDGLFPVDSVVVYYGAAGTPFEWFKLNDAGNGEYYGAIPLPDHEATVTYYVEAIDEYGRRTTLPEDAPAETFSFILRIDRDPPDVVHEPITQASTARWPVDVTAEATDPFGIDSVWVEYTAETEDSTLLDRGTFRLADEGGVYRAAFPAQIDELPGVHRVRYRLFARDSARAGNVRTLPETGSFTFDFVATGVLVAYDVEQTGTELAATGEWEVREPSRGTSMAHSGDHVWGTTGTEPYPAVAQRSTLALPSLDLRGVTSAYLVFWHWYDFEHNGGLRDGGNVKVSVDGSATWTVLTPEAGYSGDIQSASNPLHGQPAFGGFSYGWRQEIVPLPLAGDVRIRFDFGTDEGNARDFAGWYVDDLSITTAYPEDVTPPAVASSSPSGIAEPGPLHRTVSIGAEDNVGIAAALIAYTVYAGADVVIDTLRLSMSCCDPHEFSGTLDTQQALEPGDRVDYRILVADFAGNTETYPAPGDPPLTLVRIRKIEAADLLEQARPSGQWSARPGSEFALDPDQPAAPRSSVVLEPHVLPSNAESMLLQLIHEYHLEEGVGGNVKLSIDGGRTWEVLTPTEAYPGTLSGDAAHPMNGEPAFNGSTGGSTTFDLSSYAGREVWLRIDFGAVRPLGAGEYWSILDAHVQLTTSSDVFDVPLAFKLHPNFPDPFTATTTISYTIPERLEVRIDVFDLLGRRVSTLVDQEQEPGTHTLTFDGSGLVSGLYLLRLQAGEAQAVEPVVIAR